MDLSSILKQAAFTHLGQELEVSSKKVPHSIAGFFFFVKKEPAGDVFCSKV